MRSLALTAVRLSNFAAVMSLGQQDCLLARMERVRRMEGAMRPAGPELERWDRQHPPSEAEKLEVARRNRHKVAMAFVSHAAHRLAVRGQGDLHWVDPSAASSLDVLVPEVLDAERQLYVAEKAAGRLDDARHGWARATRPEWLSAIMQSAEPGLRPDPRLFDADLAAARGVKDSREAVPGGDASAGREAGVESGGAAAAAASASPGRRDREDSDAEPACSAGDAGAARPVPVHGARRLDGTSLPHV